MTLERNRHLLFGERDSSIITTEASSALKSITAPKITVLAGGPPCQPFSQGGLFRGATDDRNQFPCAINYIRKFRPEAFIFENVKGLASKKFSLYLEFLKLSLSMPFQESNPSDPWNKALKSLLHRSEPQDKNRYRVSIFSLNAANFGVPQTRERLFIVGVRADINADFIPPTPTHSEERLVFEKWVTGNYWERHNISKGKKPKPTTRELSILSRIEASGVAPATLPWTTIRDALKHLPQPTKSRNSGVHNHAYRPGARMYAGHTGSPIDSPSKTIKAGVHGVPGGENMLRHLNGKVRYFTIREAATIQTFPQNYIFPERWTSAMRQIGNAVPPLLAEIIGRQIISTLKAGKQNEQNTKEPKRAG